MQRADQSYCDSWNSDIVGDGNDLSLDPVGSSALRLRTDKRGRLPFVKKFFVLLLCFFSFVWLCYFLMIIGWSDFVMGVPSI